MKTRGVMGAIAMMVASQAANGIASYEKKKIGLLNSERVAIPKNKYNLTEEEVEAMTSMSPKQKKKFLKERSNGTS